MKLILFSLFIIPLFCFSQLEQALMKSGYVKHQNGDYYGAISDFNTSLELYPNYSTAIYFFRAASKAKLDDYYGAISDYTKSINGFSSKMSREENTYMDSEAYLLRGFLNERLGKSYMACSDYKKALAQGNKAAIEAIRICN